MTGSIHKDDCRVGDNGDNSGCGIGDKDENSYGEGFKKANGGAWAMLWNDEGIKTCEYSVPLCCIILNHDRALDASGGP
jgi:hypothetical protein